MLSRKGRIYSFGSLTLVGLVSSLVGVATQSPEAGVTAGAITATAAQSGVLSILQDKGFDLTIKLLEACGAIGLELGADDARQVLLEVSKKLKDNDGTRNHDIAKAVRRAILSILESEKDELTDKDDKISIEQILKTTEATWAWVELLEQDNLVNISEEKVPYFFSIKAENIAKIESPVKESEWKLILLEIARQNNCNLTEISLNKLTNSLYCKFPQSLREVFAQDFANEGVAYGKLLLALVGDINASKAEILDEIFNFSQKQDNFSQKKDKYQDENREWFKALFAEIKKPTKPSKIPTKLPVSRFPLRVQFFTGREDVLIAVEDSLKTYKTAALCGTHGLGKSSVVTEFAYLNEGNYKNIFFIRAVGAEFDIFIGEIVNDLQIPTDEHTTPAQKLQMFQHWLAENDNWLLILDNVDDVSAIKDCNFTAFGGDVIFTSNDDAIWQIGNRVEVPNMDAEEAASLLFQHWKGEKIEKFDEIPTEKHEALLQIAEMFGNSPLAMTFAGVYLAEEDESLDEFLETYHDKEQNLLERYEFLSNYQHANVATPLLLAFEAVSKPKDDSERERLIAEAVKDYLKISAFIAPDAIPEDFLSECVKRLHSEHKEIFQNVEFFKEVRKRFKKSPIFDRDSDTKTFSTHRLVQEVMRFKIKDEEARLLKITSITLYDIVPYFDYTNREKVEPYLGHLESFIEYLLKTKENSADITRSNNQTTNVLSYKIAKYNECFGEYEKAKYYYLICRDICEKIHGNEHQETAGSYNNLGNVYYSQGDYPKAEENHLKSLQIRLNILGENHPDTASSYGNLGNVYYSQGDYPKAEENHLKSLQIRLNIFGENHPNTAASYNNLGLVYYSQGDYPKAEENYLKSLQIYLNIFGENHPDTASSYNNLGAVYYSQGDYPKAEENHLKSLQIKLNIFGENHPDTASSYNNLGAVYYSQGDYPKAEENYLKSLQIYLNIFGENHPDTASSYNNLGLVYEYQDKLIDAEKYYEKALEIWSRFLPENHPYILHVKNNLERVRVKLGK